MDAAIFAGIIGFSAALVGGLATVIAALLRDRKAKHNPISDPLTTKSGDMNVQFWINSFQRIEDRIEKSFDQLGEKIDQLGRRLS